jgi:6-phosphogluconolactonase
VTTFTTCPDADKVAERAAAHISRVLRAACQERGGAHLALSGGTTPGVTYELLGRDPELDWSRIDVWFADERCVPPSDPESNHLLAQRTLLEPAQVAAERVHRMEGELGPAQGASRYSAELRRVLGAEPVLDLIVLGIGPDGHVASLFPGSPLLSGEQHEPCIGVTSSPKPPPERLTLSLQVLRAARGCVLLATGASKADAVDAMLAEPTPHVPASMLRRGRLTVITDDAAAPGSP